MKNVTFKEWCEIKKYGPHKEISLSKLSRMINASISYLSKLYNCQPISIGGKNCKVFNRVKDYLSLDGYNLILGDTITYGYNNVMKYNNKLLKQNELLRLENLELKKQLENYNGLIKVCQIISKSQKEIDKLNLMNRPKNNKRRKSNENI